MKTMKMMTWTAVAGLVLALAPGARAALFSPIDATSSSYYHENADAPVPNRGPLNLIDYANIDADGLQHYTSTSDRPDMWLNDSIANDPNPWVMFDLGAVYTVDSIKVWNYVSYNANGVNGVEIQYGLAGDMSTGTIDSPSTVPDITNFAIADNTNPYPGVTYTPAASFNARYVKFDISSTHRTNPDGYAGMAEVQFDGEAGGGPAATPGTLIIIN